MDSAFSISRVETPVPISSTSSSRFESFHRFRHHLVEFLIVLDGLLQSVRRQFACPCIGADLIRSGFLLIMSMNPERVRDLPDSLNPQCILRQI